jgi:hypothetical protein
MDVTFVDASGMSSSTSFVETNTKTQYATGNRVAIEYNPKDVSQAQIAGTQTETKGIAWAATAFLCVLLLCLVVNLILAFKFSGYAAAIGIGSILSFADRVVSRRGESSRGLLHRTFGHGIAQAQQGEAIREI